MGLSGVPISCNMRNSANILNRGGSKKKKNVNKNLDLERRNNQSKANLRSSSDNS